MQNWNHQVALRPTKDWLSVGQVWDDNGILTFLNIYKTSSMCIQPSGSQTQDQHQAPPPTNMDTFTATASECYWKYCDI